MAFRKNKWQQTNPPFARFDVLKAVKIQAGVF